MAKQPETILKERVLADLKKLPKLYVVKIQQVAIRGVPDILCCIRGHFIGIELKRDEKQKLEPLQEYQQDKIKEAGGSHFLVHPLNWPGVLAHLTRLAFIDKVA